MIVGRVALITILGLLLCTFGCNGAAPNYGLPIALGSTSDDVRKLLGAPTARYRPATTGDTVETIQNVGKNAEIVIEWYYSSGIVGSFNRDRLSTITLFTYSDYRGFLVYSGTVVNGVRLADSKQSILDKLGKPTKVESEPLDAGTNPDVPELWPKESRYYWHFKNYTLEATFLNQAQNVSEKEKLTFPKDKLIAITLTK